MISKLRSCLLALLSRYFNIAGVPASLRELCEAPLEHTVVTQGDSLVLCSMLESFARRSGLRGVIYCGRDISRQQPRVRTAEYLYWLSIEDLEAIEALASSPSARKFSTLNIFRSVGPVKNNPQYRMSIWRQIGLLIGCRFLVIIFGRPITLAHEGASGKQLVRYLKLDFYRNLKLVRGTPFQSLEAQARAVLGGTEFDREIRIVAARLGVSERSARQTARKAFFRMAADPKAPVYWIIARLCRFLVNQLFSDVQTRGLDCLGDAVKNGTVILVPMHRSHLDYILLSYKLYESHLNPPVVAAGENLSVWPFGFVIRSMGGYFVKRNARADRIHALLLKRYVTYLTKRGHLQEFYIEGGRSRSGKMGQPKVGLLGMMVSACLKGLRKDIVFVPSSFTYENVIEDEVFGAENTGRSKTKENLLSLLRARDLFKKRYGEVIVKFGQPISLAEFVSASQTDAKGLDERAIVAGLAARLTQSIRDQTDISLSSLAYAALMTSPSYGLSRPQLIAATRNLCNVAKIVSTCLDVKPDFTPSLLHFMAGHETIINDITRGKVIEIQNCLGTDVFFIAGKKRYTADFYRNSTIHLFMMPALLAILELLHRDIRAADACLFHSALQYDLQLAELPVFEKQLGLLIDNMLAARLLQRRAGRVCFVNHSAGIFAPAMLLSSIQSLLWIYLNLDSAVERSSARADQNDSRETGSCDYAAFMNRLLNSFKTASYLGIVTRTEAASQSALTSCLESLKDRGVVSYDEGRQANRRIVLLRDDAELIRVLEAANKAIQQWQLKERDSMGWVRQGAGEMSRSVL